MTTMIMITGTLNEGWTKWSQQAVELQLLRVDQENRKTQSQAYLQLDAPAFTTVSNTSV